MNVSEACLLACGLWSACGVIALCARFRAEAPSHNSPTSSGFVRIIALAAHVASVSGSCVAFAVIAVGFADDNKFESNDLACGKEAPCPFHGRPLLQIAVLAGFGVVEASRAAEAAIRECFFTAAFLSVCLFAFQISIAVKSTTFATMILVLFAALSVLSCLLLACEYVYVVCYPRSNPRVAPAPAPVSPAAADTTGPSPSLRVVVVQLTHTLSYAGLPTPSSAAHSVSA